MNVPSIDIEKLRTGVGRQTLHNDAVSERLIADLGATLAPFIFSDAGGAAPLGVHWCLAPIHAPLRDLRADGHLRRHPLLPDVPLPLRMWAGGEIHFLASILRNEIVTRQSTLDSVELKTGKSGLMCLVSVKHDYRSRRNVLLVHERQDIVYRQRPILHPRTANGSSASEFAPTIADPLLSWTIPTETITLFRYSALTFNSHRIHYDWRYATQVEGYAGLLVHGPLQATYLLNAVATAMGRMPERFSYRNVAPLIAGRNFTAAVYKGDPESASMSCECRSADGLVTMSAEAY